MAKREVLGVMVCPECGRSGAQIKEQKNGMLYRFCADGCNAQFFARNAEQETAMREKVGAGGTAAPVTVTEPPAKAPAVQEAAPVLPKKVGTGNPFLDLMQGN